MNKQPYYTLKYMNIEDKWIYEIKSWNLTTLSHLAAVKVKAGLWKDTTISEVMLNRVTERKAS